MEDEIRMKKLILLLLFLQSCSVMHPLPGLCYTDKSGTYLCDEENNPRATDDNSKSQRVTSQISETHGIRFPNSSSEPLTRDHLQDLEEVLNR